jgi:hypothetical protein
MSMPILSWASQLGFNSRSLRAVGHVPLCDIMRTDNGRTLIVRASNPSQYMATRIGRPWFGMTETFVEDRDNARKMGDFLGYLRHDGIHIGKWTALLIPRHNEVLFGFSSASAAVTAKMFINGS